MNAALSLGYFADVICINDPSAVRRLREL